MITEVKAVERSIFTLMQKVLAHFAGSEFRNEVQMAKQEFFEPLSVPEETTPLYETRMSQFFDWYFFTRPMRGFNQSPLEAVFLTRELRFSAEESALIDRLRQNRHSLFEFVKNKGESLVIRDLLKNEKVLIPQPNFTFEFEPDAIFEVRLIPFDKNFVFSRGFCFHAPEARKYILAECKRHRKDADLNQQELMLKLLKMNMRSAQYKHVPIEKIYSIEGMTQVAAGGRSAER